MSRRPARAARSLALPVALLAVWWFAGASSDSFYFPPLQRIAAAFGPTWLEGGAGSRIRSDVLPSVARLLVGYGLAAVLGTALGLLIGSSPTLRALLEPILELFRAIPPPAMVPILVGLAGIGDLMRILVIVFGCVWPILLNTVEGVRALDPVLRATCRCYRITGPGRIRSLVLPSAGPQIMAGLRQALSVGIILMVISEMFAAGNGIGFTVVRFQRTFAIPQMWTGIVVLGLLGVTASLALRRVEARVLGWHRGLRSAHRADR